LERSRLRWNVLELDERQLAACQANCRVMSQPKEKPL
jgi:hypothetical protein